jgi:hypothetical protein
MTDEIDEDLIRLEAWLDAEEADIRAQWLRAKARMKTSEDLRSEAISRTNTAAELIPHLIAVKALQDDSQATILGPPQDMGFNCEKLLRHVLGGFDPSLSPTIYCKASAPTRTNGH